VKLGRALQDVGRLEEAMAWYDRALALELDYADGHVAKAINLLLRGDYASGWRSYEWRWRMESFCSRKRNFAQPQWRGSRWRDAVSCFTGTRDRRLSPVFALCSEGYRLRVGS
jgi:hypothetical protein